jgi:hypothetical protein
MAVVGRIKSVPVWARMESVSPDPSDGSPDLATAAALAPVLWEGPELPVMLPAAAATVAAVEALPAPALFLRRQVRARLRGAGQFREPTPVVLRRFPVQQAALRP